METTTPAGQPIVDREKTAPFLIRAFIKPGSFHRLAQFQDGPLPTADEQQIFTWRDATLAEVLTTLRSTAPHTPEYRHPLARYSFRAVYADSANRGLFAQKDLGVVYSRDILGEPGTLENTAARLLEDTEGNLGPKDARTLDELRFVPGDYLCMAVMLPKNVTLAPAVSGELTIKGSGSAGAANGWKQSPTPLGRGGPPLPLGRGGGHWRGGSDVPPVSAAGIDDAYCQIIAHGFAMMKIPRCPAPYDPYYPSKGWGWGPFKPKKPREQALREYWNAAPTLWQYPGGNYPPDASCSFTDGGAAMLGRFAAEFKGGMETDEHNKRLWGIMVEMTPPATIVPPAASPKEKRLLEAKYKIFRESIDIQTRWRKDMEEASK
ncbi:hypothetical protein EWM64_g2960 [Hericium alpestre]|uniref:Histone deacetylase complex subunit SAP18 n=1 Tax=Hericium alpestre TaxID=135208 RepID=A0A4Z0A549_9AGAM|nr:hypothetical protein EWM64_g2960 [Hericium alpestre]